ncbi:3-keto-disaccharide hydrolase [Flavilitoribacter nigricans]|uniref:Glycosyl hydrolase n=1 Tax=Flavilitoribacter nigricans (strain ATCC 23147 / DSM 23189 / NBRC 102662 / NCIMB 1420 / SS-2) TaxID=1122177 RepID=A0A2D0N2K4_FLAN2|nr:DUF1080 domain-containing protein [Flavilitoribacter nigricans]PHN01963.1 glycosyl hydrolase [Flavilitoribacter nigricans DSM 23189 = NBRC 102662]
MNRLLPLAFLACLLWACGQTPGEEASREDTAVESSEAPSDNTLSAEEKSEGWTLLFDGQSMDQWRIFNHDTLMGWAVQSGEMVALGEGGPDGHGADIITKEKYDNFDLSLEWKISEGGNSGIFFYVVEGDQYETVYHTGPEYQLIDDTGFPGDLAASQHSGANYSMHAPSSITTKPVGEYNLSRIRVEDGHVTHWLNGKKVVEYDLWTPEWQALIDSGKWNDYPDYGKARSGHLALQDHGNKIWFKNIKIKTL